MTATRSVSELVAEHLANADTQWSLGTFGGIAEFSRDPDETASITLNGELSAVTARGGVRIAQTGGVRPFASESISKLGWNHRVALCLPETSCAMNGRMALTELGPDKEALRPDDKSGILFDLGLGARQADLCIRVADIGVADDLRKWVGRSLFEAGNQAMAIILRASPHRVFMTRVGRIEVYQPIPHASGKSPDGPHTHVLPKLLQPRRTHPATEPVPEGWIPCAHLYPAHPVKDGFGHVRAFDEALHRNFQAMLSDYGDDEAVRLKQRVAALVREGGEPFGKDDVKSRNLRTSIRVALRQLKASGDGSVALASWLAAFEPADDEPDEDTQTVGH